MLLLLFFSPLAPRVSACIVISLVVLAVCVMSTVAWYYFVARFTYMFENFQAGLICPVRRSSIYSTQSINILTTHAKATVPPYWISFLYLLTIFSHKCIHARNFAFVFVARLIIPQALSSSTLSRLHHSIINRYFRHYLFINQRKRK